MPERPLSICLVDTNVWAFGAAFFLPLPLPQRHSAKALPACEHFALFISLYYYKPPTLTECPTSRIRGLNLKGPSPRPRGGEFLRPQEKKTQPTATASTEGKKVI